MKYNINKLIGKVLADRRREKCLTQKYIGRKMRVETAHVSAIETGARKNITIKSLFKYLNALDETLDTVWDGK